MTHKVSILKCKSYNSEEVKQTLIQSLKNIEFHLDNFKNKKILIKPNLLGPYEPDKAITTHPMIIGELCKIIKQQNPQAEIFIGDSSGSNTEETLEKSGINKLSKYARIINFDKLPSKIFTINNKKINISEIIFNVDLVINIAKMKTHVFTKVTLCAKNLYGCIPGKVKSYMHRINQKPDDLSKIIFGINNIVKPQLNIIDGITGIEGNGPGVAGTIIKPKLLIASQNSFAADIIASEIMGFNPYEIDTNKLSKIKKQDIEIVGENINNIKIPFKKPSTYINPFLKILNNLFPQPKITFNKTLCQKCNICKEHCPVNTITLKTKDDYPICNHKDCIKCFCCIEMCPHNAITLEEHCTKKSYKYFKEIVKKMIKK